MNGEQDETVLTHSIKTQNEDAVRVLLLAGADPNAPSRKGVAPISAAAHKGNIPIMEMLIEAGAVVNAMNSTGSTALIQVRLPLHLLLLLLLLLSFILLAIDYLFYPSHVRLFPLFFTLLSTSFPP